MVINNNNNKLKAFTIAEALMVMILVTIFVAATANVFVKRTQGKVKAESHGRLECFYIGNQLYQHKVFQGVDNGLEALSTNYCEYTPTRFIKYVMINIVGGGSDMVPGFDPKGGTAGIYKSLFYPNPLHKYRLYPGKKGQPSYVEAKQSGSSFEEVARVHGGANDKTVDGTTIYDLNSCYVSDSVSDDARHPNHNHYFDCGASARCVINKDGTITVHYCRTSSQYHYDILHYNNSDYNSMLDTTAAIPSGFKLKDNPDAHKNIGTQDRYKSIVHAPMGELMKCVNIENKCDYYSFTYYTEIGIDPLQTDFCTTSDEQSAFFGYCGYGDINNSHKMCESCANDQFKTNLREYRKMDDEGSGCLYKLTLDVNLSHNEPAGEVSGLSRYIDVMQYEGKGALVSGVNGIEDIKPGNGGDAPSVSSNSDGHAGGILLLY